MSPPTKRARVGEQCLSQSDNQSINQSFNQSINQSINEPSIFPSLVGRTQSTDPIALYCYLYYLPLTLLSMVCSYLDLDCKCCRFPVLNRAFSELFNQSINQSKFYYQPEIRVRLLESVFDDPIQSPDSFEFRFIRQPAVFIAHARARLIGSAPYFQYCPSVDANVIGMSTSSSEQIQRVVGGLNDAICSLVLRSIKLVEDIPEIESIFVASMMDIFAKRTSTQLNKLTSLSIMTHPSHTYEETLRLMQEQRNQADNDEHAASITFSGMLEHIEWNGLSNCQSLTSLKFHIPLVPHRYRDAFRSFPPSITHLDLWLDFGDEYASMIRNALADPEFLPNLVCLKGTALVDISECLSTVMASTNKPRPIQSLASSLKKSCFDRLDHFSILHTFHCHMQHKDFDLFCELPDTVLPLLRDFKIEVCLADGDIIDMNPLFVFCSKRPIEVLKYSHSGDGEYEAADLTEAGVAALSNMQSLTTLHLSNMHTFEEAQYTIFVAFNQLPLSSMLHLEEMVFYNSYLLPDQLYHLLRAAPHLKKLDMGNQECGFAVIIPMIGLLCPHLEKLSVRRVEQDDAITVARNELQTAFEALSSTNQSASQSVNQSINQSLPLADSFQHLTKLSIREEMNYGAYHYLMHQLSCLPRLTLFDGSLTGLLDNQQSIDQSVKIYFQLVHLPHLTGMSIGQVRSLAKYGLPPLTPAKQREIFACDVDGRIDISSFLPGGRERLMNDIYQHLPDAVKADIQSINIMDQSTSQSANMDIGQE